MYCVVKILRYGGGPNANSGSDAFIWSGSNFSCVEPNGCKGKIASVYLSESQENGSSEKSDQKNSQSKCKRGDTLKIEKIKGRNLYVNELSVIVDDSGRCLRMNLSDCTTQSAVESFTSQTVYS